MRRRASYLYLPDQDLDPEKLWIDGLVLLAQQDDELYAVREERLAAGFHELPPQALERLSGFAHLHVRWVAPTEYDSMDPLAARQSPGLHVLCTPGPGGFAKVSRVCLALREIFGRIDCWDIGTFTPLHASLPEHPELHYYYPLKDLSHLSAASNVSICPSESLATCNMFFRSLPAAATFDITVDADAERLLLTAQWPLARQRMNVYSKNDTDTVEAGILSHGGLAPSASRSAVGVAGVVARVGESNEVDVVSFAVAARHRRTPTTFTASFPGPAGMHPEMRLEIRSGERPESRNVCRLYSHLTLPRGIFADQYQFRDRLFRNSKNITALEFSTPDVDLEAPAYTVNRWGSTLLLELTPPEGPEAAVPWTAQVPLHLRYQAPSLTGYSTVAVPYPVVFWACETNDGSLDFGSASFQAGSVGYESLFSGSTIFYQLIPVPAEDGGELWNHLDVPVLRTGSAAVVTYGTAAAVVLGFTWVLNVLFGVFRTSGYKSGRGKAGDEAKKRE